jgi:hypothetical protein
MRRLLVLAMVCGLTALGGCSQPAKSTPKKGSETGKGGGDAVWVVEDAVIEVEPEKDIPETTIKLKKPVAAGAKLTFEGKGVTIDGVAVDKGKGEFMIKGKVDKDVKEGTIAVKADGKDAGTIKV